MPVLSKANRPTKKIVLFEDKENQENSGWVEIYTELLMGEIMELQKFKDNPEAASSDIICKIIKDWNFTDDNKKPLEITPANIGLMPLVFIATIVEETQVFESIKKLQQAQKKSLSSSSPLSTSDPKENQ